MQHSSGQQPVRASPDPNLTVLPAIRAPIDEGMLIPYPPRSRLRRLLIVLVLVLFVGAGLALAFLRATSLG